MSTIAAAGPCPLCGADLTSMGHEMRMADRYDSPGRSPIRPGETYVRIDWVCETGCSVAVQGKMPDGFTDRIAHDSPAGSLFASQHPPVGERPHIDVSPELRTQAETARVTMEGIKNGKG